MKKYLNNFYYVKKGDTIASISSFCNVNPLSILLLNKVSPLSLKEGEILLVKTSS